MRKKRTEIVFPATVAIDCNEQLPYGFTGIRGDAKDRYLPIVVNTEERNLYTGDYSLVGFEDDISVERKSLSDFYGTVLGRREEFEDEFRRLNEMAVFALVVVEAPWSRVLNPPDDFKAQSDWTKAKAKVLSRTVISWSQRYRGVHWCFAESRRHAELYTFRTLQRFLPKRKRKTNAGLERSNEDDSG